MKLRLPLLLAVLSIVGFVVAQYENYYNNEDTSSDKDGSSFTDYLLALIVGLFFIEKFVKRKYNFTGSDNFVNLRP